MGLTAASTTLTSSSGAGAYISVATAMRVWPTCSISSTELWGTCRRRRLQDRLAWNIALGSGRREGGREEGRREGGREGGREGRTEVGGRKGKTRDER